MQNEEYLKQFENCTLPPDLFKHQGHLRITWLYLHKYPLDEAMGYVTSGIKRYATHLGAAQIYHETLTRAWVQIIYNLIRQYPDADFESFIKLNPQLFQKNFIYQYYSKECLERPEARQTWIEPDIKSF